MSGEIQGFFLFLRVLHHCEVEIELLWQSLCVLNEFYIYCICHLTRSSPVLVCHNSKHKNEKYIVNIWNSVICYAILLTSHSCACFRSVDCLSMPAGEVRLALLLQNNTVETYSLRASDPTPAGTKTSRLTLAGHRTDTRTLAFSSENTAILSASGETVKVWNRWVEDKDSQSYGNKNIMYDSKWLVEKGWIKYYTHAPTHNSNGNSELRPRRLDRVQ